MHYRRLEHKRSVFLSQYVDAVYELTSLNEPSFYKTIPKGIIGLTLLLEGSAWVAEPFQWTPVKNISVYGMIKSPSIIKVSANSRDISIGFNPIMFSAFINVPMQHIAQRFTDAADLFSIYDLIELEELMKISENDSDIISAIEKFLIKYFKEKKDEQLISVFNKISRVEISRVEQLSKEVNLTSRTLLNKFNHKIGLSPKELMKVFRIKNALNVKIHNRGSLTELALNLGYFDQAHFIHEFKETLGITPEQYFTNKSMISDFYNLERWNLT